MLQLSILFVFVFLLGLAIGSFLNVVIYRYNTGKGVDGRSRCMSCGKTLSWYELVPVLSFLIQAGKCRGCRSKLSFQYPLVELATGFIFLSLFFKLQPSLSAPLSLVSALIVYAIWCILIVIFVYDIKHKIIPDGLVYAFAALGLVRIFLLIPLSDSYALYMNLIAGPALFIPFYFLWLVSKGRWIGLGDGKLALGIGWMLGLSLGVSAIFLAFWIGAAVSILLMVIMRLKTSASQLTMKSEIPFAPYLILGCFIAYFFGLDVVGLNLILGL